MHALIPDVAVSSVPKPMPVISEFVLAVRLVLGRAEEEAPIEAGRNGLERVTFVPTQAKSLESGQPRPLSTRDAGFRKVVTHMKWASEGLRGAPEFKVRNNEIQIYQR